MRGDHLAVGLDAGVDPSGRRLVLHGRSVSALAPARLDVQPFWQSGGVSDLAATTPRERLTAACRQRGEREVVAGCVAALGGRRVPDDFLLLIGGAPALPVLEGREGGPRGHWPRVWGARGLLYVWSDEATPVLVRATEDPYWRVREMAAKVVARHVVADALEAVGLLCEDPVPRVRAAAERAVARVLGRST